MTDFQVREDVHINNLTASDLISDGVVSLQDGTVSGDLTVDAELTVTGNSTMQQNLTVNGTLTASNISGDISVFYDSVASMVADTNLLLNKIVGTIDYYTDYTSSELPARGGNAYQIVAGGTGTADGGSFIDLDNGLQAKGLFPDGVNVMQFGVKYAAEAGDRAKVQSAIDYVYRSAGSNYGGTVIVPAGVTVQIDAASLLIRQDVTLAGEYSQSYTDNAAVDDWLNVGALVCDDASYSVDLYNGSCLRDIVVMRRDGINYAGNPTGLPAAEVANFAGTGSVIVEAGAYIKNVTYLGFNRAISCSPSILNFVIEDTNIDSTNGVLIDGDNAKLTNVKVLPFLSEDTGTEADRIRSGIAFELNSNSSNVRFLMCSAIQETGIDIADSTEVTIENCFITHPTSAYTGIGVHTSGTCSRITLSNTLILNRLTGVEIDIADGGDALLANCTIYNLDSTSGVNVAVVTGNVTIDGGVYGPNVSNGGTGVTSASSNSDIRIAGGAVFRTFTNPVIDYGSANSVVIADEVLFESVPTENGFLPSVASAATTVLPVTSPVYEITGTATITQLTGFSRIAYGKHVTLFFTDAATVQHGTASASIRLAGGVDYVATAGSTLTLLYLEDNNWYEVGRSII